MYPIIALWAVPRSVSTAFERMMIARGDFIVPNEPFSVCYYFSDDRVSTRYQDKASSPDYCFDKVYARIRKEAETGAVFFKDMSYHVARHLETGFYRHFTNTFLIRHPERAIPSLYRRMPDFTLEETGYMAIRDMFRRVEAASGTPPPLIDGDDLRRDASATVKAWCEAVQLPFKPEALEWEPGHHAGWNHWNAWYKDVVTSDGFKPPEKDRHAEVLEEPRVQEAIDACLPIYEALRPHCISSPQE